jgi:23S rRNA (pseudouridine1915-N3)-methyltransferase
MKLLLAAILPRRARKSEPVEQLFEVYMDRCRQYVSCTFQAFDTEADLLKAIDRQTGRTAPHAIFLDSRGQQFTSEEFARRLGALRDEGNQQIVLAIGPADGWSPVALQRANLLFSLGRITLPHQLARVVLAEQVYRALTILSGHPYHSGH